MKPIESKFLEDSNSHISTAYFTYMNTRLQKKKGIWCWKRSRKDQILPKKFAFSTTSACTCKHVRDCGWAAEDYKAYKALVKTAIDWTWHFVFCEPTRDINLLVCSSDHCRGWGADATAAGGVSSPPPLRSHLAWTVATWYYANWEPYPRLWREQTPQKQSTGSGKDVAMLAFLGERGRSLL